MQHQKQTMADNIAQVAQDKFDEGAASVTPQETPTLLWTNPNPNSAFAAQTVNLDLSEYNSFVFKVRQTYSNSSNYFYEVLTKGKVTLAVPFGSSYPNDSSARLLTIDDSKIVFASAISTGANTSTNWCIPIEIYGLKTSIM